MYARLTFENGGVIQTLSHGPKLGDILAALCPQRHRLFRWMDASFLPSFLALYLIDVGRCFLLWNFGRVARFNSIPAPTYIAREGIIQLS